MVEGNEDIDGENFKEYLDCLQRGYGYSKKQSSMQSMRAATLTMRGRFVVKMLRCLLKFIRSLRII